MQEDMLVIISLICESDPAHKEACVETKLVKIIIHYLRDLPGKVVSGLRCDQLLLGVLDCLFNSILGNEAAEDKFLALEGKGLILFICSIFVKRKFQIHEKVHFYSSIYYRKRHLKCIQSC